MQYSIEEICSEKNLNASRRKSIEILKFEKKLKRKFEKKTKKIFFQIEMNLKILNVIHIFILNGKIESKRLLPNPNRS